ncbi:alpha/beta hydrolase [Nocardia sp. NPDC057668]|uniref:alpha/beta hydrolase n=1 Tax=Nocardia sp. NPDC057668 TaxID=3346202 RepID=UPI00366AF433
MSARDGAGVVDSAETVIARTVDVDGIPMSALVAEAPEPRAVLVAVHGGATTAQYFDLPDRPRLSLLRLGAKLGFTVLALDRPGYGSSAPWGELYENPGFRVAASYSAIDALLESRLRGAGVFLLGHSAGCDLAVRMAADERGADLLGLEIAGIGLRKHAVALRRIEEMRHSRTAAGIRELLWDPAHLYPAEVYGGQSITSRAPGYESAVVRDWPGEYPGLAGRVRIPVRSTHGQYEQVWRTDREELARIEEIFGGTPRFLTNTQAGSGHNLSVGFGAAAYHLGVLSFAEECVLDRTRSTAR